MKLHELKKNEGATFRKKIVGRGRGSGLGKTLVVVEEFHQYSKVDNYHYIEDFQKEDLVIMILKQYMQLSMSEI